jgi:hypothetical protein
MRPYICIDLSLSEQLVHLSAAAHLVLSLFAEDGTRTKLMPTQLYIDIMIMIKNVYFCIAKAKVDDPEGLFWIILLGTDRLEELFGLLRTMVGSDSNLDMLQLGERITNTVEVSTIFAKYPWWDKPHEGSNFRQHRRKVWRSTIKWITSSPPPGVVMFVFHASFFKPVGD